MKTLTDEKAMDCIRMHNDGMTYEAVAEKFGCSPSAIRALCQGVNRGHLLMQVEREPKRMIG